MRRKSEAVLRFESNDDGLPKVVRAYRDRYRAISQVLDDNLKILTAVHQDLLKLSEGDSQGREGDYTSENILRALIVQHLEGLPFRDAVIRIGSEPFLQDFTRMRKRPVMDYSFLDKCFLAIAPTTWKRVNELLGQYGVAEEAVSTNVIRTDTTVVESNIHYPTDASLLWDTWRVASRLLKRAMEIVPGCCLHRLHDRKIKRLYLYVTRYMPSKSASRQRKVKASFRTLIERTEWIVAVAEEFWAIQAGSRGHSALAAVALELQAYLPAMKKVVAAARRAQVDGETVPARERVFSLFEQHTELIKRGRREKPVEFGHKVLLCESAEKFITDYAVYAQQEADCELTESVIDRHHLHLPVERRGAASPVLRGLRLRPAPPDGRQHRQHDQRSRDRLDPRDAPGPRREPDEDRLPRRHAHRGRLERRLRDDPRLRVLRRPQHLRERPGSLDRRDPDGRGFGVDPRRRSLRPCVCDHPLAQPAELPEQLLEPHGVPLRLPERGELLLASE